MTENRWAIAGAIMRGRMSVMDETKQNGPMIWRQWFQEYARIGGIELSDEEADKQGYEIVRTA